MVSASQFQPEGLWFEPGLCRPVASLDKKKFSILASLYRGVQMGTGNIMLGGNLAMD